jgi:hypothetical protein
MINESINRLINNNLVRKEAEQKINHCSNTVISTMILIFTVLNATFLLTNCINKSAYLYLTVCLLTLGFVSFYIYMKFIENECISKLK